MLILAKAAMALLLGFILAIITGVILIPILKRFHIGQYVSHYIGERHLKKEGTPTMGGLIFIIPTIVALVLLYINGSIEISHNLVILIFVFLSYAMLGFVDDYLKIKYHNNKGLSIVAKLLIQMIIALVFFYIFMSNGGQSDLVISSLGITIPLGWTFGLFILFLLVGSSNAVNITDGLDGLAGGLSAIAFFAFGLISWNAGWMEGYQEVAIFCFILAGALMGFLVFNAHPAKVFMGDTGSLLLGGVISGLALYLKMPLLLLIIALIPVLETLSVIIQVAYFKKTGKRIFKMAPLHHHFELCGWKENKVVIIFSLITLLVCVIGLKVI